MFTSGVARLCHIDKCYGNMSQSKKIVLTKEHVDNCYGNMSQSKKIVLRKEHEDKHLYWPVHILAVSSAPEPVLLSAPG